MPKNEWNLKGQSKFSTLPKLKLYYLFLNKFFCLKIEENYEIAEKVNTLKEELKLFEEDFNQKYTRRSNEINDIIYR